MDHEEKYNTARWDAGQVRREVFLADGEEFTRGTVARILEDHRMFREDVAAGAFRPLRPVTR